MKARAAATATSAPFSSMRRPAASMKCGRTDSGMSSSDLGGERERVFVFVVLCLFVVSYAAQLSSEPVYFLCHVINSSADRSGWPGLLLSCTLVLINFMEILMQSSTWV